MVGQALTPGSREAYTNVWANVLHFMMVTLQMPYTFPFPPSVIAMYVVHLNEQDLQPNTIKQKLSAIVYLHKLHKAPDPCKAVEVVNVMRAITWAFVPPEQKHPITIGLLECILEVVHLEVQGT